jgi:predicted Zn-dependent protease
MDGRVYQLLGYTQGGGWGRYARPLSEAVRSFGPLRESWAFEVQPKKLKLVDLERNLSVAEFARRYPSSVPVATVALLNQVEPTGTLKAGQLAKQVVGGGGTRAAGLEQ